MSRFRPFLLSGSCEEWIVLAIELNHTGALFGDSWDRIRQWNFEARTMLGILIATAVFRGASSRRRFHAPRH